MWLANEHGGDGGWHVGNTEKLPSIIGHDHFTIGVRVPLIYKDAKINLESMQVPKGEQEQAPILNSFDLQTGTFIRSEVMLRGKGCSFSGHSPRRKEAGKNKISPSLIEHWWVKTCLYKIDQTEGNTNEHWSLKTMMKAANTQKW